MLFQDDEDIDLFDSCDESDNEEEWGLSWEENDVESLSDSEEIESKHQISENTAPLCETQEMSRNIPGNVDESSVGTDLLSSPGSTPIERMALNDNKAGMEGLDKEKINKIIHDASKGSKFYENEKRKEKQTQERIDSMKSQLRKFSEADRKRASVKSNQIVQSLQTKIDLTRTLVHVDMDAFYAAVEMRDNPGLKDVPMAVGGKNMLCTSNYVARRYGVRAAMPGFIAKKLCPQLVIVPTHFDKYRAVSAEIRQVFKEYDENFATVSLDEAYLDITDYIAKNVYKYDNNSESAVAEHVVSEMREKIFQKTQLTSSAGIAHNLMLSKICSDLNKPNGQYYLKPDEKVIHEFVRKLPIRKVHGIGKVSEQMLKALDVLTCEDLFKKRDILLLLFSESSFDHFMRVSMGLSANRITHDERKSMSSERTFHDISDKEQLLNICSKLCEHLAKDLAKENLQGRNVTLKYKLSSFITKTRSKTLSYSVSKAEEIYGAAKELLLNVIKHAPEKFELRLMGVRVSQFAGKDQKKIKTVDEFFVHKNQMPEADELLAENASSAAASHEDKDDKCDQCPRVNEQEIVNDRVPCPVCGVLLENNNISLNEHIDNCLTKQTIKEIVREQNVQLSVDSVAGTSNATSRKNSPKKRKLKDCDNKISDVDKKKTTLYSFWKKDN